MASPFKNFISLLYLALTMGKNSLLTVLICGWMAVYYFSQPIASWVQGLTAKLHSLEAGGPIEACRWFCDLLSADGFLVVIGGEIWVM